MPDLILVGGMERVTGGVGQLLYVKCALSSSVTNDGPSLVAFIWCSVAVDNVMCEANGGHEGHRKCGSQCRRNVFFSLGQILHNPWYCTDLRCLRDIERVESSIILVY